MFNLYSGSAISTADHILWSVFSLNNFFVLVYAQCTLLKPTEWGRSPGWQPGNTIQVITFGMDTAVCCWQFLWIPFWGPFLLFLVQNTTMAISLCVVHYSMERCLMLCLLLRPLLQQTITSIIRAVLKLWRCVPMNCYSNMGSLGLQR